MSEARLQAYFIKKCKLNKIIAVKIDCPSRKGWPDVMACTDWGIKLIEFKSDTGRGRLSEHQKRVHAELKEDGHSVSVFDCKTDVDRWVQEYQKYDPN